MARKNASELLICVHAMLRTSFSGHTFANMLGFLRITALAEGISFLVLLLIAMPLKYFADQPAPVRYVGMAHGVLFVLYCVLVLWVGWKNGWRLGRIALALVASIIPLGTFWADARLFKRA